MALSFNALKQRVIVRIKMLCLFIYLFNKITTETSTVPGNIVDAEKIVVSKPIKYGFPWSLYFNARRQAINK